MSASQDKARDARRHDFFVIDNEIVTEHAARIGVHAVAVYCALVVMANGNGQCWPAHATIAKQLGMSRRGVQNALAVLEAAGLIGVRRRPTGKGMAHKTSVYTILPVAKVAKSDAVSSARDAIPYSTQCATPSAPSAQPMAPSAHEQDPLTIQDIEQPSSANATEGQRKPAPKPTRSRIAKQPAPQRERSPLFDAFCRSFGVNPDRPGNRAGLAQAFATRCRDHGATVAQFREYYRTSKAAGDWGRFDQPHNVADRFLAAIAPADALDDATPADARPPIGAVLAPLGLSTSNPAKWPADVLAAYRDVAAQWGYVEGIEATR